MTLKLRVDSSLQRADLFDDHKLLRSFVVSTAKNGLGCVEGSYCTPTGRLRVAQKFGDGLPLGAILRARTPTGEIWNSTAPSDDDLVLSRILWLEGAESTNQNTLNRYIYLHGTNSEHLLGQPVSHGCVRFSNPDIVELYDLLPVGSEVEIF